MKVELRTLQNESYKVEIFLTDTVKDVKKRIESTLDLGKAENMKLCFKGSILVDEQIFKDIEIDEKSFLVVMRRRPRKKIARKSSDEKSQAANKSRGNSARPPSQPAGPKIFLGVTQEHGTTCPKCTLINKKWAATCTACGEALNTAAQWQVFKDQRPIQTAAARAAPISLNVGRDDTIPCALCTYLNDSRRRNCEMCATPLNQLVRRSYDEEKKEPDPHNHNLDYDEKR